MITGTLFFRDLGGKYKDKRLFLAMGQLWVPANIAIKNEYLYKLVGSEFAVGEPELITSIGLQVLLNSGEDISNVTSKKHPSQIISHLHTPHP